MFTSFDHRIAPPESERVLHDHPALADCAVVPLPHPIGEWEPKAFAVVSGYSPVGTETATSVLSYAAEYLPAEKRVRVPEFVPSLPRTASGKVIRTRLRERGHSESAAYRTAGGVGARGT